MDDLRKLIAEALAPSGWLREDGLPATIDAVMAVFADLGHTDDCVHPDQHAAVIRDWEDAKAELERLRAELAETQKRKQWAINQADAQFRARREAETERDRYRLAWKSARERAKASSAWRNAQDWHEVAEARGAAIERVRAIHREIDDEAEGLCEGCSFGYPCITIAALDHPTDTPPRRRTEQDGGISNDAITPADWAATHRPDTTGETETP